jgi:hypothetical protein
VTWLALVLALLACTFAPLAPAPTPEPPTGLPPTPEPTATPAPVGNGRITGALGYPSEVIPPMTLYFANVDTADVLTLSTDENEASYSKSLPPGTYHVYAWLAGFGLGGAYSAAVPCGLTLDCTDHSLIPVTVNAGTDTTGIDVLDWYGPPGSVPLPAGATQGTGSLQGVVHFPSEGIPPLTIYARNVATNETFNLTTAENQADFTLAGVAPGVYHVFAWVSDGSGLGGAYTQAVPCGLSVDCTDHTLIAVPVAAGQPTTGVDIADWYDQSVVPLP